MKKKVHVVSYTHWDREFRWEFELTRMKLVDCIDHLLDIMTEQPEYRSFLMDGQIGLLDDYLEIRPEKEGLIRQAVAKGSITLLMREFGRGTDFICHDEEMDRAGGVHVIQTFIEFRMNVGLNILTMERQIMNYRITFWFL